MIFVAILESTLIRPYLWRVTVDGTKAANKRPRGRMVLRAEEAASKGPPLPRKLKTVITYELITIRFGGMAARNSPIGRKAASALRKSLKLSLALK